MASYELKDKSINAIRTNLLLLADEELSILKKNNETKINSKKITDAEEYYCNSNKYVIKLQEENFIPSSITRDVIQNMNMKNKFSFKSPDSYDFLNNNLTLGNKINRIYDNDVEVNSENKPNKHNLDSNFEFELDLFAKKSIISSRKNHHFKVKTLKLSEEQKLLKNNYSKNESNNVSQAKRGKMMRKSSFNLNHKGLLKLMKMNNGNSEEIKLKMRTEKGYIFLQNLVNCLKIVYKKRTVKVDYDEITKAISNKELFKIKIETALNSKNKEDANDELDKDSFYSISYIKKKDKGISDGKNLAKNFLKNNCKKQFPLTSINATGESFLEILPKKTISDKNVDRERNANCPQESLSLNAFNSLSSFIKLDKCKTKEKHSNSDSKKNSGIQFLKKSSVFFNKNKSNYKINFDFNQDEISEESFDQRKISNTNSYKSFNNYEVSNSNKSINNYLNSSSNNYNSEFSRRESIQNPNDKSNNLIHKNAADSFKSLKENSFKIQLKSLNEDRKESVISEKNNEESECNESQNIYNPKKVLIDNQNENITSVPRSKTFAITNFNFYKSEKKMNILKTREKSEASLEIRAKDISQTVEDPSPKLKLDQISNSEFKKNRKNSSFYFKSSDYSSYCSEESVDSDCKREEEENPKSVIKPLNQIKFKQEKETVKNKQKNFYKIEEINFLNSLEIKKKNKANFESETNTKNENNYLHSTDTSSFIQRKKIQNEELSNSKEKFSQSKIINLFAAENHFENISAKKNDENIKDLIFNYIMNESKLRTSNNLSNNKNQNLKFHGIPKNFNEHNNLPTNKIHKIFEHSKTLNGENHLLNQKIKSEDNLKKYNSLAKNYLCKQINKLRKFDVSIENNNRNSHNTQNRLDKNENIYGKENEKSKDTSRISFHHKNKDFKKTANSNKIAKEHCENKATKVMINEFDIHNFFKTSKNISSTKIRKPFNSCQNKDFDISDKEFKIKLHNCNPESNNDKSYFYE